jgi:hypothetical protein
MVQFINPNSFPGMGQYFLVGASQTTKPIGNVGATGDFLYSIVFLGTGAATLFDGTTAIITYTAAAPTTVVLGIYSKTGAWNVTTAASTSVLATGQFT